MEKNINTRLDYFKQFTKKQLKLLSLAYLSSNVGVYGFLIPLFYKSELYILSDGL